MDKYRHRALHDLLKLTYFRIVAVLCTLYNNCIVFLFRLLEYYANIRIADLYEDSTPTDNPSTINIFSLISLSVHIQILLIKIIIITTTNSIKIKFDYYIQQ